MNQKEFDQHIDLIFKESKSLLTSKGAEYSDNVDRLSNFYICNSAGVSNMQNCLVHIGKHMSALHKYALLDSIDELDKHELNQSLHERVMDLINYFVLLDAILKEERMSSSTSSITLKNL
jgi:hypothetical protein